MNETFLTNASQLVERNRDELSGHQLLVLAPPADNLITVLQQKSDIKCIQGICWDRMDYQRIQALWNNEKQQVSLHYGSVLPSQGAGSAFDGVLLFVQKSRPMMDFWLDMVQTVLKPEGQLWVVGENDAGIKSWIKRLGQRFSDVVNLNNARHCRFLVASGLKEGTSGFNMDDYAKTITLPAPYNNLSVISLPGVFSHGRLDKGTELLLGTLEPGSCKRVLDFGCGAGVIGMAVAMHNPKVHITLADSNALALESAKKTFETNHISDFETIACNGLEDIDGAFDMVISNPPFHQGIHTSYEVTERFLRKSADLLKPGGELRIVANSFLSYPPIIVDVFGECRTMVSRNGFSVYRAFLRR